MNCFFKMEKEIRGALAIKRRCLHFTAHFTDF